ncbi:unnamed protein product [Absidia cylindrospora]
MSSHRTYKRGQTSHEMTSSAQCCIPSTSTNATTTNHASSILYAVRGQWQRSALQQIGGNGFKKIAANSQDFLEANVYRPYLPYATQFFTSPAIKNSLDERCQASPQELWMQSNSLQDQCTACFVYSTVGKMDGDIPVGGGSLHSEAMAGAITPYLAKQGF